MVLGADENIITIVASHELDPLINCERHHAERFLHLHFSLFLGVGYHIEQMDILLHRNAEHRLVDFVHLRLGQELLLI